MKIPNKREIQNMLSNHSSDSDFKDFIKLHKDYTKESFSFPVNDTTLIPDNESIYLPIYLSIYLSI